MTDNQTSNESTKLDDLLDEYKQPNTETLAKDINTLADSVRTTQQKDVVDQTNTAVSDAVAFIKGDKALKDIPDSDVEDFLQGEGRRDQSIRDAFDARSSNPSGWEAARNTIKTRLVDRQTPKDTTVDDVTAAKASVRGMTTTPPEDTGKYRNSPKEAADISGMSDLEFQAHKRKVIADQRSG